MFDLEQAIADWRRQMQDAGIESPVLLDELESHLRDELDECLRSGKSATAAFDLAVSQVGRPEVLTPEFGKLRQPFVEKLKQWFGQLAGSPNYQLATTMNVPPQNLEPRWATYLKTAAFILPGIFVWAGLCFFVLPKLRQLCNVSGVSGTEDFRTVMTALAVADFIRRNLVVIAVVLVTATVLLEWRSSLWRRYRRLIFGVSAGLFNAIVLVLLAMMVILAVLAGAHLAQGH